MESDFPQTILQHLEVN